MSLENWHKNGWLRTHETNRQQISDLFAIVERDLDDADYLDSCRAKRNTVEYDVAGRTSPEEARELIEFVFEFKGNVLASEEAHSFISEGIKCQSPSF